MADKNWAILIYQSADNNLSEEIIYSLKEMKKEGTFKDVVVGGVKVPVQKLDVITLFDPIGRGSDARLVRIKNKGGHNTLEEDAPPLKPNDLGGDVLIKDGAINMADKRTLIAFLRESIKMCRDATKFMVILNGHGAGVVEGFFLTDEERPLSLIPTSFPLNELRDVFDSADVRDALSGRKINILGFDACMMSMVEVCYELHDLTALDGCLVMASEGFTLNTGWPYERIMQEIKDKEDIAPDKLTEFAIKEYVDFYGDYFLGGLSSDQAIINLNQIRPLKLAVDGLADALIAEFKKDPLVVKEENLEYDIKGKPFQDAILLAHWAAQSYNGEQCVDLYDFCDLLQARYPDGVPQAEKEHHPVFEACKVVKGIIQDGATKFVKDSKFTGAAFQYSRGVSIYFPWSKVNMAPNYETLTTFGRESKWKDFLEIYFRATQRPPRIKDVNAKARSTPPYGRGPEGKTFSMRNPPTEVREKPE
jgi:Clostripain family